MTPEHATLLNEKNQLQDVLKQSVDIANMLPRALQEQERLTVEAALSGSDEARSRLEDAMGNVRKATEAKSAAEALRSQLAATERAIEAARSRELALEAEGLRKKFEREYTVYKDNCQRVKDGLSTLIRVSAQYRDMSGGAPMPNWGESRERWLNLPAIAGPHDDVTNFPTGQML